MKPINIYDLSRCIPAIHPPYLISAPPVSYVIPLPTKNNVVSTVESSGGLYSNLIIFPLCLGTTSAARLTAAKQGYDFSNSACPSTTVT
jgi:hypothetical protein